MVVCGHGVSVAGGVACVGNSARLQQDRLNCEIVPARARPTACFEPDFSAALGGPLDRRQGDGDARPGRLRPNLDLLFCVLAETAVKTLDALGLKCPRLGESGTTVDGLDGETPTAPNRR